MPKVLRTAQMKRYDALCKKILSEKGILANIMTGCVPEYRSVSVADIVNRYIEGIPEIGVPILETPLATQISGDSTEFSSEEEGRTTYDVCFSALAPTPTPQEMIQLLLNLEAQNDSYPGYPLLKRASFHCGRMISSQYGKFFVKSDYGKLRKVYSIWVCPFPRKGEEYTINLYRTQEEHIIGNHKAKREHYDNFGIIVICLGNKKASELTGLMRLLTVLFRDTLPAGEVNTILRDEYSIELTPDIEKGVAEVCNLSAGLVAQGYERGDRDGFERGDKDGFERGQVNFLRQLMQRNGLSSSQAMDMVGISADERPRYQVLLNP